MDKSLDELISENRSTTQKNFKQRNFSRPQNFTGRDRQGGGYRPRYDNSQQQNYNRSTQKQQYINDDIAEDVEGDDREENTHHQKIIHKQIRKPIGQGPRKQIFTKKFQSQQNNNNESDEEESLQQQIQQQHKSNSRKHEYSRQNKKRLNIQNLNKKIDNNELRELFSTHGKLVKCGIVWDDLGYSTGVAIVEFEKEEEAKKAINDYHDAELDGEVLKVTYCDKD